MYRYLFFLCIFLFSLHSLSAAYTVVEHGVARAAIIIPDHANSVEKTAAAELQHYLLKATGGRIPIVKAVDADKKAVGGYKLGRAANMLPEKRELDSWNIRFHENYLHIGGGDGGRSENQEWTAAGTLFGVYHYLHHALGIRWLWPGETGEYVPKSSVLQINEQCDGTFKAPYQFVRASAFVKDPESFRWGRRVMHTSSCRIPVHAGTGGHAFEKWVEQYGKEHPEWFAMQKNGKRNPSAHTGMCISNEAFQAQIVNVWQELQSKKESLLYINLKENDTQNRCMCRNCRAWDGPDTRGPTGRYAPYPNVGERYARFYRSVWEKAAGYSMDARVSFYAYQSYFYAPRRIRLNANHYVGLVPDLPFPRRPSHDKWLREEYLAWKKAGATIYLRPNYFLSGYCMPEVWYDQYADELKFLYDLGCAGIMIDGPGGMWATRGLDYYVMGRLCVEPYADPERLAEEFYSAFGAGASDVKAYFEYFRRYLKGLTAQVNDIYEKSKRGWYFHGFHYASYAHRIFPEAVLRNALPYLEHAIEKVHDDAVARTKVKFLIQGLHHAVATVKCAALFADLKSDAIMKRSAWGALLQKRAELPPFAVNNTLLERIEKNVWEVVSLGKGDHQALPEIWHVMADPLDRGEKLHFFSGSCKDNSWRKASTWKTLEEQNFMNYIHMWYRTKVHIAEKSSGKVILRLGAVDENCSIWVNGQLAGKFRYDAEKDPDSWKKPLEFNITKYIRFGMDNLLVIKVTNSSGDGGLWKPSYLSYRP